MSCHLPHSDDEFQISDQHLASHPHLGFPIEPLLTLIGNSLPSAPTTVLDIGCGFGEMACRLALRYKKASIVGVDIEPMLISIATMKTRSLGLDKRCSFQSTDVSDKAKLKVLQKCDLVVMLAVRQIYTDMGGAIRIARSLLRSGGYAVVDTARTVERDSFNVSAARASFVHNIASHEATVLASMAIVRDFDQERSIKYVSSQMAVVDSISFNTGLSTQLIENRLRRQRIAVTRMRTQQIFQAVAIISVGTARGGQDIEGSHGKFP